MAPSTQPTFATAPQNTNPQPGAGLSDRKFERLAKASYRDVQRMAYRLCGNRCDAEDLTQEAFFRAFRRFDTFDNERSFTNWVSQILTRIFIDGLRKNRRAPAEISMDSFTMESGQEGTIEFKDDSPTPEKILLDKVVDQDLLDALNVLPLKSRELITAVDVNGIDYREIAAKSSLPHVTVRTRLHRARYDLRCQVAAQAARPNLSGVAV